MTSRIRYAHIKWRQRIERVDDMRLRKQVIRYRPQGRRDIGRPRRRWLPVSYTHLDVYKRQRILGGSSPTLLGANRCITRPSIFSPTN